MSWEVRHGRRYYYRRCKADYGAEREYIGAGPIAELIADTDAANREEQRIQRDQERTFRQRWRAADQAFVSANRSIEALTAAVLVAAGFHRHDRGKWRKRRASHKEETKMEASSQGQESPFKFTGTLVAEAETAWLELIADGDRDLRNTLRRDLQRTQSELADPADSPLAAMLIRRIALCQLQAAFADATYARRQDVSLTQAKFLLERQRTTHQRLLQASTALAQVRKLAIPKQERTKTRSKAE